MRIDTDRPRASVATQQASFVRARAESFAGTLAAATEKSTAIPQPTSELSAATYRLFAAVAVERGNTDRANYYLSQVAGALEPTPPRDHDGVLSETGRWDYDERSAVFSETGIFDPGTGQGQPVFEPYGATDPASTSPTTYDRLRPSELRADTTARALRASIAPLFSSPEHSTPEEGIATRRSVMYASRARLSE